MCNDWCDRCGWCNLCFCFRDIKRIVVAVGTFQLVCSLLELILTVAVFTAASQNGTVIWGADYPASVTYDLYIVLSCLDFFMILFAILMLYGNERFNPYVARSYLYPWIILLPFYIIFESATNIYYFYNQFNKIYKVPLSGGSALGYVIPPLVYWAVKDILLIIAFIYMLIHVTNMIPTAEVEYIHQVDPVCCHEVYPSPPMAYSPEPVYAPACHSAYTNACSGGGCGNKCLGSQPLYGNGIGWASMTTGGNPGGGVVKDGWTTSVFNNGH